MVPLISGRPAEVPGIEKMVGIFINMLPVKVSFKETASTATLLGRIQRAFQESQQHGYLPLAEVQRQSRIGAGERLFDTIVAFENYPLETAMAEDATRERHDVEVEPDAEEGRTNFKLVMGRQLPHAELKLRCDYDAGQFSDETIVRLMEHMKTILRAIAANESLQHLDLLTDGERALMTSVVTGRPATSSYTSRVEQRARQTPDAVAVVCGDASLTYGQLNGRANQLAAHLEAIGVTPGSFVGVCVERSLEGDHRQACGPESGRRISAARSVVSAGPVWPTLVADSGATVELTQSHLAAQLGGNVRPARRAGALGTVRRGRRSPRGQPPVRDPGVHHLHLGHDRSAERRREYSHRPGQLVLVASPQVRARRLELRKPSVQHQLRRIGARDPGRF